MRWFEVRIAGVLALSLVGCGGDKAPRDVPEQAAPQPLANAATQPAPAPAPTAAAPASAAPAEPAKPDAEGVVRITSGDQMRYSATRIEVSAGQKIKIELKNTGALAKDVMGHDLVVLKPGSDVNAFAIKAMAAKATDYIPADAGDQMLAHTRLLGPGESQILELDALAPGTYPFLCTFPGHVGLMNGVLVVQQS
jgi:azurin